MSSDLQERKKEIRPKGALGAGAAWSARSRHCAGVIRAKTKPLRLCCTFMAPDEKSDKRNLFSSPRNVTPARIL